MSIFDDLEETFDDVGEAISEIGDIAADFIDEVKEIGDDFVGDMAEIAEDELGVEDAKEKITVVGKIISVLSKLPLPFPKIPGGI